MAELSRATGVPIPTIKYYLREGLLPGGERTSRNQARYGDLHVRRIRLVRALADYGGLPIATIKDLLRRADDPDTPVDTLLREAQRTVTAIREPDSGERWEAAAERVRDLMERRGWQRFAKHPAAQVMTSIVATFAELGHDELTNVLEPYAEAVEIIAAADLAAVGEPTDRARAVEIVVIGTLLGDSLIAAMRRIAQSHTSLRLHGDTGHGDPEDAPCAEPGPDSDTARGGESSGEGASGSGATRRRPARRSGRR